MNLKKIFCLICGVSLFLAWSDPAKQEEYDNLVKEIRCVTCPNQSIADSQAPIAVAMCEDIARRLEAGETQETIREYLLSRYGDYITYRPAVNMATSILWWGPVGFLLLGIIFWVRTLRRGRGD